MFCEPKTLRICINRLRRISYETWFGTTSDKLLLIQKLKALRLELSYACRGDFLSIKSCFMQIIMHIFCHAKGFFCNKSNLILLIFASPWPRYWTFHRLFNVRNRRQYKIRSLFRLINFPFKFIQFFIMLLRLIASKHNYLFSRLKRHI